MKLYGAFSTHRASGVSGACGGSSAIEHPELI